MNMKQVHLLAGRILVLPDEPITMTRGGLHLPDSAKEKPRRGKVVAVAKEPHRYDSGAAVPIEVKTGDHVLYGRFGGIEFEEEESKTTYLVLAHNDVFAVLPE
jgi:chaperonin GroES